MVTYLLLGVVAVLLVALQGIVSNRIICEEADRQRKLSAQRMIGEINALENRINDLMAYGYDD